MKIGDLVKWPKDDFTSDGKQGQVAIIIDSFIHYDARDRDVEAHFDLLLARGEVVTGIPSRFIQEIQ